MTRSRRCRVFLAAEGPSEIGDLADLPQYGRGREGYLQPLLRRLAGDDLDLEFTGQRVTLLGRFERRPRLKGHADRAAKALALATVDEADVLVFAKDVDRTSGRRASKTERLRKLRAMAAEIDRGFDVARQVDPDADAVTALRATPCRMIEAWALADPDALREVAPDGDHASVPATPEASWGNEDDPQSAHPKCLLKRALGRAYGRADLSQLATTQSFDALEQRCPDSFGPFLREARAAAERCMARAR